MCDRVGVESTLPLLSYGDGQLINLRGFILGCPWYLVNGLYKVGPLPVINGVITPISRVITPVTHL